MGNRVVDSKRAYALAILAIACCLANSAIGGPVTAFTFASPTDFSLLSTTSPKTFDFPGYGEISATVAFRGSEISFATSSINAVGPGLSNPDWMGGTQPKPMFRIVYAGSASSGPKELVEMAFSFSTPLSTQSYMLFTDFDSYEGLAIAAFDTVNGLIPFNDLTLTRVDGEQVNGASNAMPLWTNSNPTQAWTAESGNTGWVGANAVSGFLQDTAFVSTSDTGVAIQSARAISRVVFYGNMETISGTGNNSIRFNFASPTVVPEPSSLAILGLAAIGVTYRSRRRKVCSPRS